MLSFVQQIMIAMNNKERYVLFNDGNVNPKLTNWPNIIKYVKNVETDLVSVENENEAHFELTLIMKEYKMIIFCEQSKDVVAGKIKIWLYYVAICKLKGCWNPAYSIDKEMKKSFHELKFCEINPQGREVVKEVADEAEAKAEIGRFLEELNRLIPTMKIEWEREEVPEYGFDQGERRNKNVYLDDKDLPF